MKKLSKRIAVLVVALLLVLSAITFAACDPNETTPETPPETPSFTVTFDLGEYESGTAPKSETVAKDGTLALPTATWEGHTLLGWKKNGEGDTLEAGAQVTVTEDVTYIAQWQEDKTKSVVPDGTTFEQLLQMLKDGTVLNYKWTMTFMNSVTVYEMSATKIHMYLYPIGDPNAIASEYYCVYEDGYTYRAQYTVDEGATCTKTEGLDESAFAEFYSMVEDMIGVSDVTCKDGRFVCHIVEQGGSDGNESENVTYDEIFENFNTTEFIVSERLKDFKSLAKD